MAASLDDLIARGDTDRLEIVDRGARDDALDEMLRLLTLRDSEMYRELLREGFERNLPPHQQAAIARARELLARDRRDRATGAA